MKAAGECPEPFGAGVTVIKLPTEFLGHNVVKPIHHDADRPRIPAQIIFGGKAVNKQQMHRQKGHAMLRDIRQPVVRRKQDHAGNSAGLRSREISRHTAAERFADEISRPICGQQLQGLIRGAKKFF